MDFASALDMESRKTFTENGATAYNTSGDGLLDFFASAGSLRESDVMRKETLFEEAFKVDPLLATKALFYVRDIRGGLGERQTFRELIKYIADKHPEAIIPNIPLIGEYGRYDDLYALTGTSVESIMWDYIKNQLAEDEENMKQGKPVSLLAKWLKTADASSEMTRKMGIATALCLGMTVRDYKKKIKALRKYLDIVERKMSANEWNKIDYSTVPSKAMTNYRTAFYNHDSVGFDDYLNKVSKGEAKINSSTLFPYDILEKYDWFGPWGGHRTVREDSVLEAQWKALPDYVGEESNAIVIADTSGSMSGRPINSAVALAIYFAERNKGAYHNLWMSFSMDSKVQRLKGDTLAQKLMSIDTDLWDGNTNLERAFMNILDIAIENKVKPEEMVKSLIIISDMEIDYCVSVNWSFYDEMKARYEALGYEIPNIVFWNVNSRHDVFHADKDRRGVQLCSGQSASTFKTLMSSVGLTPTEMMMKVLNSERYEPIKILTRVQSIF